MFDLGGSSTNHAAGDGLPLSIRHGLMPPFLTLRAEDFVPGAVQKPSLQCYARISRLRPQQRAHDDTRDKPSSNHAN